MSSIKKILLLDDDEANQLFFDTLLAQMEKSFSVYKATTAPQAEALVNSEHIQFIICAWEMSPVPGTLFIQRIKRDKQKKYLPFIIYSKRMDNSDILLTKELGIENILGMPFNRDEARQLIEKIIDSEDRTPTTEKRLRRIETLLEELKYNEALKHADNSIFKHPDISRVHTDMGEIWIGIRNFPKAKEYLDKALEAKPDNVHALRLLARWHSLQDNHQKAIEILEKITEQCPKSLKTLISLGKAYVDANDYENAEKIFQKVESIDEDCSELKDERGIMAFKRGNYPLAAQLLAETDNANSIARSFNDMGIAKIAQNAFDEGIELYENAINLLSDKTKTHLIQYNLALAWYKKGNQQKAFTIFCESYLTEPSFEKAYNALAKLARTLKDSGQNLDKNLIEKIKKCRKEYKKND